AGGHIYTRPRGGPSDVTGARSRAAASGWSASRGGAWLPIGTAAANVAAGPTRPRRPHDPPPLGRRSPGVDPTLTDPRPHLPAVHAQLPDQVRQPPLGHPQSTDQGLGRRHAPPGQEGPHAVPGVPPAVLRRA